MDAVQFIIFSTTMIQRFGKAFRGPGARILSRGFLAQGILGFWGFVVSPEDRQFGFNVYPGLRARGIWGGGLGFQGWLVGFGFRV